MIAPAQRTVFEATTQIVFTRLLAGIARLVRSEELTLDQLAALHLIHARPRRVSDLSTELGLSPSAGSRLVEVLVGRGMVVRAEDEADRRVRSVSLTPVGASLVARISAARVEVLLSVMGQAASPVLVRSIIASMSRFLARRARGGE